MFIREWLTSTKPLTSGKKEAKHADRAGSRRRGHAFSHVKGWRILTKLRLDTRDATTLLRALLVLTSHEVPR